MPENHGDHANVARAVAIQGAPHLSGVAVVRREEVRADQAEDDVRILQVAIDRRVQIGARRDSPIVNCVH